MTFKRDREGQTVVWSLEEGTLNPRVRWRRKYFYSLDPGAASGLAKDCRLKRKGIRWKSSRARRKYGPWFALGSALALMAVMVI